MINVSFFRILFMSPTGAPAGALALAPAGAPVLAPAGAPPLTPAGAPVLAPAGAPPLAPAGAPVLASVVAPAKALRPYWSPAIGVRLESHSGVSKNDVTEKSMADIRYLISHIVFTVYPFTDGPMMFAGVEWRGVAWRRVCSG